MASGYFIGKSQYFLAEIRKEGWRKVFGKQGLAEWTSGLGAEVLDTSVDICQSS